MLKNWSDRLRELRLWALNDVTSSQIDVSSVSTSEQTGEYTMSAVIENQHTIINNQNITISYLGTICFLITISIGIYLVIKFGKWIYSLIKKGECVNESCFYNCRRWQYSRKCR